MLSIGNCWKNDGKDNRRQLPSVVGLLGGLGEREVLGGKVVFLGELLYA